MSRRELVQRILDHYLSKEDVQELADDLGLDVSGTKDDVVRRVVECDDFDPVEAIPYLNRGQLRDLCGEIGLDDSGTLDALIDRVLQKIQGEGPAAAAQGRPRPSAL